MKLHLPKLLLTAVLAAYVTPMGWAFGPEEVSYTEVKGNTSGTLSPMEDTYYSGVNGTVEVTVPEGGSTVNIKFSGASTTTGEYALNAINASSTWFAGSLFIVDNAGDLANAGHVYSNGGCLQFRAGVTNDNNFTIGTSTFDGGWNANTYANIRNAALLLGVWNGINQTTTLNGQLTVAESAKMALQYGANLNLTGALVGSSNLEVSTYSANNAAKKSTLTLSGTAANYTGNITLTGHSASLLSLTLTSDGLELRNSAASINVNANTVLDLNALKSGNQIQFDDINSNERIITRDSGYVLLSSADAELNLDGDRTVTKNYKVEGNLALNGKGYSSGNTDRTLTVADGESFTVTGSLDIVSNAVLKIAGGSVEIDTLNLGHTVGGNFCGKLLMESGTLKLGTIHSRSTNATFPNQISITGGTVEFTDADILSSSSNAGTVFSIKGVDSTTENLVVLKANTADTTLDGANLKVKPTIGNICIDADNTHRITLSNLTISGSVVNNSQLSLGEGVEVADGTQVALSGTGTTAILSTITNGGTISLSGNYSFDTNNGNYVEHTAATATGVYSHTDGKNGYALYAGGKLYAIKGNVGGIDVTGASITVSGEAGELSEVDDGYVFDEGTYVDRSIFYVNEGTITANTEGYTDIYDADTYELAADTTFNVNGQYFAGKTFKLAEGSTLSNTGAGLNGNYKMLSAMELTGNATVHAETNMGLLAFNSADSAAATSTLKLNGHTLEKTGTKAFFLTGTTVEDAGTIKITEGVLQVGIEVNHASTADTSAENVDFVLNGGTLYVRMTGNQLTAQSLSGTGTVNGAGVIKLNHTGDAVERTVTGNVTLGGLELTGNDNYTINGNVTVSGYTLVNAGNLTLGEGTHRFSQLDISKSSASDSVVTLTSGANVTVTGQMWLSDNASIQIEHGASLSGPGGVKVEAKAANTNASISFGATSGDSYTLDNANYTHHNAKVTVAADATNGSTIAHKLNNSELVNSGTGLLQATNAGNVLTGIDATTGSIHAAVANQVQSLDMLAIGSGKEVSVMVGSIEDILNRGTLQVIGTATFGEGATLNANLALQTGTTVTLDGPLDMGGSTLTLGESLTLDDATVQAILDLPKGGRVNLFTNVGSLVLDGTAYDPGSLVVTDPMELTNWFALSAQEELMLLGTNITEGSGFYLGYDANGTVYAGAIPEPTTATLSLLALAALAARRRRK